MNGNSNALTAARRAPRDFMPSMSEQAWSAGWMRGLEYELWKAVQSAPDKIGRSGAVIDALRGWVERSLPRPFLRHCVRRPRDASTAAR